MRFTTQTKVLGAKYFKDSIDGQSFDITTIFVVMDLDDSQGRAKGCAAEGMQWGDSSNFDKLKGLNFPFEAQITLRQVTSGKRTKMIVEDVKPAASAARVG